MFYLGEYKIGQHFLPALINGDESGLCEGEAIELEDWYQHYANGSLTFDVKSDETDFVMCDISKLKGDCHTVDIYTT